MQTDPRVPREPASAAAEIPKAASVAAALLPLAALTAAVRLVCLPFTSFSSSCEYVDAPTRVAMAVRWLEHPGFMTTRDCAQFGPLHIYLIAWVLRLWHDLHMAPILLSLALSTATVVPLFLLARLLFGHRAAVFCAAFFALQTLSVKTSNVVMAEATFGFLFFIALYLFFRFRRGGSTAELLGSAFMLSLASLVRYEGWLYIPLMGLLAIRPSAGDGRWLARARRSLLPAAAFVATAGSLPVVWLLGNALKGADPFLAWTLFPPALARLSLTMVERHGVASAMLFNLFFPPTVVVLCMTPLVAFLAAAGLARSIRRRQALDYALLFLPFLFYFAQEIGMKTPPLARYWMLPGLMLLPYAGAQMDAWTKGLPASGTRVRMAAVMLCAAIVFVGLALLAYVPNMPPQLHARLWNVAPVSPLLPEERKALEVLKDRARPGERFILDGSDFSRNVLFSLDPAICEHWFDSLRLVTLTPDGIVDYLKASAPGILLHDKMNPPFEAVLNQRAPDKAGFRTRALYSAARFALYELIPAQSVPAPH